MSEVIATYLIQDTKHNLEKKAESISVGLTVGSWTDLPSIEQQQLSKHKGHVLSVEVVEQTKTATHGVIKIAYPTLNFSEDLPAVLTTVFGKLSLDGEVKLIDLEFPSSWNHVFAGPRYGIEGIREFVDVYDRPLIMSIFKAAIGRDIEHLGVQLRNQALGGVDFIKDDEILFENPLTPFEKRITSGKEILDQVYTETGKRTRYAVNLTGRTSSLKDKARKARELGADALLFNVFAYGLDVLAELREDDEIGLPIMAHPAVSGALASSKDYGFSHELLLGKLVRLCGADFSLFPSPYGSVALERSAALGIGQALTEESAWKQAFPVPSAGIHPGLVPLILRDYGVNCVINAGGGVHGHPDGAAGGEKAFTQAVDAALAGITLQEKAETSAELRKAIELWGATEVTTS